MAENKTMQDSNLLILLDGVAVEISSKLDAMRPPWPEIDHSHTNWASEISHPCLKHLVHCRLDWKDRQQIDLDGRWRVDEGKDKEWAVKRWLGDIGFEITQSQKRFYSEDHPKYQGLYISGRIDGLAPLNQDLPEPFTGLKEVPAEVKSTSPHYWQSTTTIQDIARHQKFWISKIPHQLNTYLALSDLPGGLLIMVTFGKRPRILPMVFDQEMWDHDTARIRKVNDYVEKKEYPAPMPFDPTTCSMCNFNHLCAPLKTIDFIEIEPADKIELEIYLETKEQNQRFKAMRQRLIGTSEKPGKYWGKNALIENIEVNTRSYMKKTHEVPNEVKEQYRGEDKEVIVTTIERID